MSGEAATGAQQVGIMMTNQFLNRMLDPFVDGRSGAAGTNGPALGFAPERKPLPDNVALAYSAALKAPVKEAASFAQFAPWGAAYGASNRTGGDPIVVGSHDLSARTRGFVGGFDHWLTPNAVMGIALGGGGANWGLAQGLGGGRSDAFQAGVYGAARAGHGYLAGAFAYTNQWMSTDRLSLSGTQLTANFTAQSLGARVEGGYRLASAFGALTPYAAVQTQRFHTPSYGESDTTPEGFALSYLAFAGTAIRNELGAHFDRMLVSTPNAALGLRARVAWAHDSVTSPTLTAGFQSLPGANFLVTGAAPLKNAALVSAGSEMRLANGLSLLGKFDGEFAGRVQTYAGTGTLRLAW
ncbi:MAG: autotransporter outer membrane beta-barrel domain-containing protein [Xanthobacteraceae bacterium]